MKYKAAPSVGRSHRRLLKRNGIVLCALALMLCFFLLPRNARRAMDSLGAEVMSSITMQKQLSDIGPRLLVSALVDANDIDSVCVLAHSIKRQQLVCPGSKLALLVAHTVFESLSLLPPASGWADSALRLGAAGWDGFVVVGAEDDISPDDAWEGILRSLFLCGAGSVSGPCDDSTSYIVLHPRTFLPMTSGHLPVLVVDFCSWLNDPRAADLLHPVIERDPLVSFVLSCASETLLFTQEDNTPLATKVSSVWTLRLVFVVPVVGLTPTTARHAEIACLTRASATNRVLNALVELNSALRLQHSELRRPNDGTNTYDALPSFTVPLALTDQCQQWIAEYTALRSAQQLQLQNPLCATFWIWFLELFEELARFSRHSVFFDSESTTMLHLRSHGGLSVRSLLAADVSRNMTTSAITVKVGDRGASCLSACASVHKGCAPAALNWWFPNSCEALRLVYPHATHCAVELPAAGKAVAPALLASRSILLLHNPSVAFSQQTCAASDEDSERVCTCIDSAAAAAAVMEPLTNDRLDELAAASRPRSHDTGGIKAEVDDSTCPCPIGSTSAPTEELEQQCLEYLSNYSNVFEMVPMRNDVKFGRTAKLQVKYAHPCVTAVLKPPQKSFPLEPFAEYIAFEVDRMLKLNYVPPTTWLFAPFTDMEAALQGKGSLTSWFTEEVLLHAVRSKSVVDDTRSGRVVIGCSVQLWVGGLRWQRGTPLDFDDTFLDLLSPRLAAKLGTSSWEADHEVSRVILRTAQQRKHADAVMKYLSDTVIFDTIIGNDDRSAQKNSNVYMGRDGKYHFAHVDQGKSFYAEQTEAKGVLKLLESPTLTSRGSDRGAVVCVFRKQTRDELRKFGGAARFSERVKDVVPAAIWKAVGDERLFWAETRMEHVKVYMERCNRLLGERAFPWD